MRQQQAQVKGLVRLELVVALLVSFQAVLVEFDHSFCSLYEVPQDLQLRVGPGEVSLCKQEIKETHLSLYVVRDELQFLLQLPQGDAGLIPGILSIGSWPSHDLSPLSVLSVPRRIRSGPQGVLSQPARQVTAIPVPQ